MSVQVEKLEKNMAKLTVEVSTEDFKAAIKKAYNKTKNRSLSLVSVRARLPRQ